MELLTVDAHIRILAVDDVSMNLEMIEVMLSGPDGLHNMTMLRAKNGREALDLRRTALRIRQARLCGARRLGFLGRRAAARCARQYPRPVAAARHHRPAHPAA